MENQTLYSEATESFKIDEVPLSHLSIEVGHFLMTDLVNGVDSIHAQFRQVAPLVTAFTESARARFGPNVRVSTCFLIDDYFERKTDPALKHLTSPPEILGKVLASADECGVTIDYLAREAGCWESPAVDVPSGESIKLAEIVAARIVDEPRRGATGRRPPPTVSGWLCNGRRAEEQTQAMRQQRYENPEEYAKREHSVVLDVEMWDRRIEQVNGIDETRIKWSCPFLASVWQLLRLGMLRYEGKSVVEPRPRSPHGWPAAWWEMPAVTQLNPNAKPFAAYRTVSILPSNYLGVEHAVRVILDHVALDQEVTDQIVERGAREKPVAVRVSRKVTGRIAHVLLDEC